MRPRKEYPTSPGILPITFDQPPSTIMYSKLFRAQKSMQYFTVALFLPLFSAAIFTLDSWLPFHQSQDVSAMALGGFKLTTMFDSTSRPGLSAIISTRHPDLTGVCAITDNFNASTFGSKAGATSGGPPVGKLGRPENQELFVGEHLELAKANFAEVGPRPADLSLLNVHGSPKTPRKKVDQRSNSEFRIRRDSKRECNEISSAVS
jgi:hypothetical protein